jgi:hypothetical protein
MQRKQEKELEDLTVETKQASAVKGGIVPEAPERTVVDPNHAHRHRPQRSHHRRPQLP